MAFSNPFRASTSSHSKKVKDLEKRAKNRFVHKVYSLLIFQVGLTDGIAFLMMSLPIALNRIYSHLFAFYAPFGLSMIVLIVMLIYAYYYPYNLLLLILYTALNGYVAGVTIAQFSPRLVFQAFVIILGIFCGLTAFAIQSKWDFSGLGPFVSWIVLFLIIGNIVSLTFIPFVKVTDMLWPAFGVFVISLYILFDTWAIMNKGEEDEYVYGAIRLYLDVLNLFILILQFLSNRITLFFK